MARRPAPTIVTQATRNAGRGDVEWPPSVPSRVPAETCGVCSFPSGTLGTDYGDGLQGGSTLR